MLRLCFALLIAAGLAAQGPREVKLLLVIADISAIRDSEQAVEIDFVLRLTWKDPSLAHEGDERVTRALTDGWHPRGQLVNGSNLREVRPRTVDIEPDGTVIYRQRYVGPLSQRFDFSDFPKDRQTIKIELVSSYLVDEVRIVADENSGRLDEFSIPDWRIGPAMVGVEDRPLLGETYSAMSVSLAAEREMAFYIWKILVPLAMIVFMSWCVFWISPTQTGPQIGVATTSVLTLIAYRFALGQTVPNLPYLTRMDYFITGASVLVFLALIEVIYTSALAEKDRLSLAQRIDRACRWGFPVLFFGIVAFSFWL